MKISLIKAMMIIVFIPDSKKMTEANSEESDGHPKSNLSIIMTAWETPVMDY